MTGVVFKRDGKPLSETMLGALVGTIMGWFGYTAELHEVKE